MGNAKAREHTYIIFLEVLALLLSAFHDNITKVSTLKTLICFIFFSRDLKCGYFPDCCRKFIDIIHYCFVLGKRSAANGDKAADPDIKAPFSLKFNNSLKIDQSA